jgi:hypothetical protein
MLKTIIPLTLISLILIGCGSSSKSKITIDMVDYLPDETTTKTYLQTVKNRAGEQERNTFVEKISSEGKTISIKIDDKLKHSYTIHDESITKKEYGTTQNSIDMKRFLSKGSTLYTIERSTDNEEIILNKVIVGNRSVESKKTCKLHSELKELDSYSIPYKDDILKFECIKKESIETKINEEWEGRLKEYKSGSMESDYDLSYFYLKKGIGLIVEIDNNCYVTEDDISRIDDKSKKCNQESSIHNFFLD